MGWIIGSYAEEIFLYRSFGRSVGRSDGRSGGRSGGRADGPDCPNLPPSSPEAPQRPPEQKITKAQKISWNIIRCFDTTTENNWP